MKKILAFTIGLIGIFVTAGEFPSLKTDFSTEAGAKNWRLNTWKGYHPLPKTGYDPTEKAFHVEKSGSEHGFGLVNRTEKLPAKAGDVVSVKFQVRGSGRMFVSPQCYSGKKWSGIGKGGRLNLSSDWSDKEIEFTVEDIKSPTTRIMLTFGGNQGTELWIRSFSAEVKPARYSGNTPIPRVWRLFAPVPADFQPKDLTRIPEKMAGISPVKVKLDGTRLDLGDFFPEKKVKNCAWLFAEVESPFTAPWALGGAADWWLRVYLNGKSVIDTLKTGNGGWPLRIDQQTAAVTLQKGRNVIAVKYLTGKASSTLELGASPELRKIGNKIQIAKTFFSDEFDRPGKRSGDPELLRDILTTGVGDICTWGRYRAPGAPVLLASASGMLEAGKYLTAALRIRSFGQKKAEKGTAVLFFSGKKRFSAEIQSRTGSPELEIVLRRDKQPIRRLSYPAKNLPADFRLSVNETEYLLEITSVVTGGADQYRGLTGISQAGKLQIGLTFQGKELVADDLLIASALPVSGEKRIPYKFEKNHGFDPVKAGWKLVFSDDFNSPKLDTGRWHHRDSKSHRPENIEFADGLLRIRADRTADKRLMTSGIWSNRRFNYGYFEARLRFTHQPGWWAAFWLFGSNATNPFLDGFEIDIFEDYYFKRRNDGQPPRMTLDHNYHVSCGSILKSWNYQTELPRGTEKDFHILGCKWSPMEISYFLDGKLIAAKAAHSPHDTLTFDAINHITGTVPLHLILSGQIMGAGYNPDPNGKFPEYFEVDYVKAYEQPRDKAPAVKWRNAAAFAVKSGEKFTLRPEITPAATGKKIKTVYLFDNGSLIAAKSSAPYDFSLAIDRKHYLGTAYMKPGRSGKAPRLDGYPHNYVVMAQDESGEVGVSDVLSIIPMKSGSKPHKGTPVVLPGALPVWQYDDGGQNIAYYDITPVNIFKNGVRKNEGPDCHVNVLGSIGAGEWLNYTVEIAKAGNYDLSFKYGCGIRNLQSFALLLDGREIGRTAPLTFTGSWSCTKTAGIKNLQLPAGRHKLTFLFLGGVNIGDLKFTEAAAPKAL